MTTPTSTTKGNTNPSHQAEGIKNNAQRDFMSYVYTLQTFKTRLKGIDENSGVHINQKEIETRFFKHPTYNRKNQIKYLVEIGALKHWQETSPTTQHKMDMYLALRACGIDPGLVPYVVPNYGKVQNFMLKNLLAVSLIQGTPSTDYFDCFLKFKHDFKYLFFKFDNFSGRLHTPVTSFPAIYRPNILLYSNETASVDVATMQPLLLGLILKNSIGDNQFSSWIDAGEDVYQMLMVASNLADRNKGKERFFQIIFAPPSNELNEVFGKSNWITWINQYKSKIDERNPHSRQKRYSNLAWLLQRYEVELMKRIWTQLYAANIPFLTVHDEIIVEKENLSRLISIMQPILAKEFQFFKLNQK